MLDEKNSTCLIISKSFKDSFVTINDYHDYLVNQMKANNPDILNFITKEELISRIENQLNLI
jgi:uncharacterized short protein YbdD (DUF466 family)